MPTVEKLEKELADTKAKAEENVKALQAKLSEKDLAMKKVQEQIAELEKKGPSDSEVTKTTKQISELTEQVKSLTGQIETINTDRKREELAKQYPDILPDLLIGKSPEEAEVIVNKQRKITMQNYDQKPSSHSPVYKDRNEIDAEVKRVQKDPKLSTVDKMTKVRELKLKKDEI